MLFAVIAIMIVLMVKYFGLQKRKVEYSVVVPWKHHRVQIIMKKSTVKENKKLLRCIVNLLEYNYMYLNL